MKTELVNLKSFLIGVNINPIVPYDNLPINLSRKVDALMAKFPDFRDWGYFGEGNLKTVFFAVSPFEGDSGNLRLAVKMDKPEEEVLFSNPSDSMLKHYRNGYNSRREANMALNSMGIPGFSSPIACRNLSDVGYPGCYAFAENFVDSVSLEQLLEKKNTIPAHIAANLAKNMIESVLKFRQRTNNLHRDLKPSNILVCLGNRLGEIVITDTSAAGLEGDSVDSYTHSCPGRTTCDPRLMGLRTNKPAHYNESSEVYSLVKMFGMMLLGKDFLPVDPYINEPLDTIRYDSQLKSALNSLPKGAKKFKKLLYNGLTLNEDRRTKTLDKLVLDLNNSQRPSITQKIFSPKIGGLALTGTLLLGTLVYNSFQNNAELLAAKQKIDLENRTIHVSADWDGNNSLNPSALFDMEVGASGPGQRYPQETSILHLNSGESAYIRAKIIQKPLSSEKFGLPYLIYPIRVSVDGTTNIAPQTFHQTSEKTKLVPPRNIPFGTGYPSGVTLDIPTNLPAGNYTILIDALPPREVNPKDPKEFIISSEGSEVLAEQRIPLIVGPLPQNLIRLSKVRFSVLENELILMKYNNKDGKLFREELYYNTNYSAVYTIPELNFKEDDGSTAHINLPSSKETPQGRYTLLIDIKASDTGEKVFSTSYPLSNATNHYGWLSWDLTRPPTNFPEKVAEYRANLKR